MAEEKKESSNYAIHVEGKEKPIGVLRNMQKRWVLDIVQKLHNNKRLPPMVPDPNNLDQLFYVENPYNGKTITCREISAEKADLIIKEQELGL